MFPLSFLWRILRGNRDRCSTSFSPLPSPAFLSKTSTTFASLSSYIEANFSPYTPWAKRNSSLALAVYSPPNIKRQECFLFLFSFRPPRVLACCSDKPERPNSVRRPPCIVPFHAEEGILSLCRDRFPFAEARNACTQSYEHRSVVAADDTGWHCARAWYHTRSR